MLLAAMCATVTHMSAQIVPVNEGRTTIEVEAEARDFNGDEGNADGGMYAHVYANHNFLYSKTTKAGIEGRYEYNSSGLHYFRLAAKGMHTFKLNNGRPLVVNANIYGEASDHGIEYFDGYLMGAYMYKVGKQQQNGIGAVILLHNPMGVPCVPIYIFNKTFDSQWSLNFLTYIASLNYDINSNMRISGGYAMSSQRFWLGKDDNICMANRSIFTPQVAFRWFPCPTLSLTASTGYRITMTDKLYTRHGGDEIANMKKGAGPFISARAVLSL